MMNNFSIILIDSNNLEILNPTLDQFNEELEKIAKIVTVNPETFIEIIGKHLQMDQTYKEIEFMGTTEMCYETYDKKIYEFCHIDIIENQIETRGNNVLAGKLSYIHKKIDGPVVLFGYKINLKTGLAENIDMNFNDLKDILLNKFFHQGVYVHNSGNMCEFTFHNDLNVLNKQNQKPDLIPRLKDISLLLKSGTFFEFSIYKYNLIIVTPYFSEYSGVNTNKIVTIFLNKMIAKGDFIILNKISENDYTNFSIKEFKQMVYLYDDKDLKSEDILNEKVNGLQVIKNRHMILYNKFKKYKSHKQIKVNELLNDNIFLEWINKIFEQIEKKLSNDGIFNMEVYNELKNNVKKDTEKQKILDAFLKDKNITISQDIEIDISKTN